MLDQSDNEFHGHGLAPAPAPEQIVFLFNPSTIRR